MTPHDQLGHSVRRTARTFLGMLPLIAGVLALASLVTAVVPLDAMIATMAGTGIPEAVLGAAVGGISAGHPTVSYVLAGEFRDAGVSLAGVTAFLVSWVTVGLVQLPAESAALGLRFAVWRNVVSFLLAIALGYAVEAVLWFGG